MRDFAGILFLWICVRFYNWKHKSNLPHLCHVAESVLSAGRSALVAVGIRGQRHYYSRPRKEQVRQVKSFVCQQGSSREMRGHLKFGAEAKRQRPNKRDTGTRKNFRISTSVLQRLYAQTSTLYNAILHLNSHNAKRRPCHPCSTKQSSPHPLNHQR